MNNSTQTDKTQNTKSLSSSVLSRIELEHVAPTPRSRFLVWEGVLWFCVALALLAGAWGVAGGVFVLSHVGWGAYRYTHDTFPAFLAVVLPYTWFILFILALIGVYAFVRYTRRGYRHSIALLCATSGLSLLCLGMLFLLGGWGSAIDTRVGRYVPFHSSLREIQLRVWDKPERGILSGVITDVLSDSAFTLRSPSHELHTIRMDTLSDAMRARVVVGNELRIFAPLVTHEPEALTSANLAGTDLLSSDTVAPAAMMTTQADEVGAAKMMSKGAAVPAERMQLETKTAALPLQPRAFALNPTVLREACAVLPLFGEDDIPIPHDCGINVPAGD